MMARKNTSNKSRRQTQVMADAFDPPRRIIQESGSAFQIGPGNALEQADGVS
jgi:hypothetical protein